MIVCVDLAKMIDSLDLRSNGADQRAHLLATDRELGSRLGCRAWAKSTKI